MAGDDDQDAGVATGAVTVFAPISHPILKSLDPVAVSKFIKERERYELEVEQKKAELPSLTAASYNVSIDRGLLANMVFLGKFDTIAPNKEASELTSNQVKRFIESIVKAPKTGFDPKFIDKALIGFKMPMNVADPEARVLQYANDMFERLQSIGYGEFREKNPKMTVRLMCDNLAPKQLREQMERRIDFDPSIRQDVKAFVRVLCTEAASCQTYTNTSRQSTITQNNSNRDDKKGSSSGSASSAAGSKRLPICLWPDHKKKGLRHRIMDCQQCPEA